ncbi:DUF4430 domain-containing protein [Adlercreutzia sp. ZJ141]|uniref:DUF4430 domain-containing protein n=1 Tax=Adlercreutzia sp. ZJ141 TaxID=2709406 RepID=UPI0013E9B309|nr:DUF4430 domain-containing protein [Adlercreutzia sp. ZJ141]
MIDEKEDATQQTEASPDNAVVTGEALRGTTTSADNALRNAVTSANATVDADESHAASRSVAAQNRSGRSRTVAAVVVAVLSVVVIGLSSAFLFQVPDSPGAADMPEQSKAATHSSADSDAVDAGSDATGDNGATDSNANEDDVDAVDTADDGNRSTVSSSDVPVGAGASTGAGSFGASGATSSSSGGTPSTAGGAPAAPNQSATVTVSVGVSGSGYGNVSGGGTFTFERGATAYDALMACGLSVNASQSQYGVYVSAIGGLAEKEHGGTSGWVYSVNGVEPAMSCSAYVLADGDVVQWRYVV